MCFNQYYKQPNVVYNDGFPFNQYTQNCYKFTDFCFDANQSQPRLGGLIGEAAGSVREVGGVKSFPARRCCSSCSFCCCDFKKMLVSLDSLKGKKGQRFGGDDDRLMS